MLSSQYHVAVSNMSTTIYTRLAESKRKEEKRRKKKKRRRNISSRRK